MIEFTPPQQHSCISVIIPVYNVEKYLEECLNSVINQEFKNIEILCINDGSTDNSLSILEEFRNKDNRIKVFSQTNKGISAARNLGLDNAKGDYIYFLDSDDYISPDYLKNMYDKIVETNADLVINDNIIRFNDKDKKLQFPKSINPEKLYNIDTGCIKKTLYNVAVWSKLFKKSIIDKYNIRFPEKLTSEDVYFCSVYYVSSKTALQFNQGKYFYRMRDTSITHDKSKIHGYDIIEIFEKIYEFYKQNNLSDKFDLPYRIIGYRSTTIDNYKEYRKKVLNLIDSCGLNTQLIKKDKKLKALLISPNIFIYRINKFLFSIMDEREKNEQDNNSIRR